MTEENDISDYEDQQADVSEEESDEDEPVVEEDDEVEGIDEPGEQEDDGMGENDEVMGDDEEEIDEEGVEEEKKELDKNNSTNNKIKNVYDGEEEESDLSIEISDDETTSDEEEDDSIIYHKLDYNEKTEYIKTNHSHLLKDTYNNINVLSIVQRDGDNNIIDENHKTIPILTKYEKTRILGIRLSQLNNGAPPYVNVENTIIIDNNIIAEKELLEKKIPMIIMRPLPNGKKEYWKLSDLEIITY